jgi:ABC-2 type transport system ATP-binding protein
VSATPAIELRSLRKSYRKGRDVTLAVNGLDLVVYRGEVFGLLGPNGAGKTTTVEICEGLTVPDSGEVRILGREWRKRDDDAIRARIGVCLQETKFHENANVGEVLALFRSCFDSGRTVEDALQLVSLEEKRNARQKSLSGGQRQRLAVAAALLGNPELLFLDEPTTGLDPQSRRQLWDVVRDYQKNSGTVLLTTHYMDEAQQLCDRVAIVDQGQVIAIGSPAELIRSLSAEHFVIVDAARAPVDEDILAVPDVAAVERQEDGGSVRLLLTVKSVHRALPSLLQLYSAREIAIDGLSTRHATLEDVFVHLTGRHLREGDES